MRPGQVEVGITPLLVFRVRGLREGGKEGRRGVNDRMEGGRKGGREGGRD